MYIYIYMHLARDSKSTYLLGMFLCRLKDHCASVFHFRKTQDKRETSPRTNLRNLCLESCKFLCKPSILGVCLVNKDPKVKCRELSSKLPSKMGKGPWMPNGARARKKKNVEKGWDLEKDPGSILTKKTLVSLIFFTTKRGDLAKNSFRLLPPKYGYFQLWGVSIEKPSRVWEESPKDSTAGSRPLGEASSSLRHLNSYRCETWDEGHSPVKAWDLKICNYDVLINKILDLFMYIYTSFR